MKQPTQSNRASKSADKISRKSESLNGAFVPPIKTASVRPLSLSAKVVEVPPELMGIKSPRGATVSLKEAQLMKSPTFVLSQLQKEATDWEQFDRAFSDGAGRVASSRLEEYEVLEELGRGRFGEVNKAREKKSGEMYAMKSILREDRDDISICIQHALVERKILSSVSHPYICELKCAFQDPSKVYFMLQYLPGGDLMKMIEHSDGKGLSANAVMIYSAEIALALDYLHERHIIYRDLS